MNSNSTDEASSYTPRERSPRELPDLQSFQTLMIRESSGAPRGIRDEMNISRIEGNNNPKSAVAHARFARRRIHSVAKASFECFTIA